jgi:hypothetical protein
MWHLTDLKMKIKPVVQSLYDFDSSMAPSSISGNATRAQALLNNVAFIYRVRSIVFPFIAYRPSYAHRNSMLAEVLSIRTDIPAYKKPSMPFGSRTKTTMA